MGIYGVCRIGQKKEMTDKIRIKDIAERAGVSTGTVDRVLHDRPNVSAPAREKVERALKEMNYQPNVYASALAYNKRYTFVCLLPESEQDAYWEEIEQGAKKAMDHHHDFRIDVRILYYRRFSDESFGAAAMACLAAQPDGVVLVPPQADMARAFAERLHDTKIPFVLLDSYMPELQPLSFFGQDSHASGYFAARILMLIARGESEIMIFKRVKNGHVTSKQQVNREMGFRHYMSENCPETKITELLVPFGASRGETDAALKEFFSSHPAIHHGIAFNSKAHIVGEYLLRKNMRSVQIMGYDMVHKNAECLRHGSISFLIAQHAYQQGFCCIDTLFQAIVLKKKVNPVNYMPIELLSKENIDFYRRTQL